MDNEPEQLHPAIQEFFEPRKMLIRDPLFDGTDLPEDEDSPAATDAHATEQPNFEEPGSIDVIDPASVTAFRSFIERLDRNDDQRLRLAPVLKHIDAVGTSRPFGLAPSDQEIDDLDFSFPNFSAVIEGIRDRVALDRLADKRFSLPPILLLGPPGIGKSEIAHRLSELTRSECRVIDMASVQTGSSFSGSEAYWGNTRPGILFEALMYGMTANPIILLEEIDKVSTSHYNPVGPLLQLIEPRSAKRFHDLSVPDLQLDASHVIWIATANMIDDIDKPLLSRFTIYEIESPDRQQTRAIAASINSRIRSNNAWGEAFPETLAETVIDLMQDMEPRLIVQTLTRAFGTAARAQRASIEIEDIMPVAIRSRNRIGF
jgi:ATP-dependent Lon protease